MRYENKIKDLRSQVKKTLAKLDGQGDAFNSLCQQIHHSGLVYHAVVWTLIGLGGSLPKRYVYGSHSIALSNLYLY